MTTELQRTLRGDQPVELSGYQPDFTGELLTHLVKNVKAKLDHAAHHGDAIEVLDPEWCREHPEAAGRMHADIILHAYGPTYALPNKDADANTRAIEEGSLDLYLMKTNGVLTGTACLVDTHDGRAELGRAASIGHARNGIIQDMRIIDWLTNDDIANKYHTLFTTLRNAPDRHIHTPDGANFTMRGGQAVTGHWKQLPGLRVYGIAPLYLKAQKLEQFTYSALARTIINEDAHLHILDEEHQNFVSNWHLQYGLEPPVWMNKGSQKAVDSQVKFFVHYPPLETGLTGYVHADIVRGSEGGGSPIDKCIEEAEGAGSPFIQAEVPVDSDTTAIQQELAKRSFSAYGYRPGTDQENASLLFGRLREGVKVVPTFWDASGHHNPFWHGHIGRLATQISKVW